MPIILDTLNEVAQGTAYTEEDVELFSNLKAYEMLSEYAVKQWN
jgi:hypothetical protein